MKKSLMFGFCFFTFLTLFLISGKLFAQDKENICYIEYDNPNITYEVFFVNSNYEKVVPIFKENNDISVGIFLTNNSYDTAALNLYDRFEQFSLNLTDASKLFSYRKEVQDDVRRLNDKTIEHKVFSNILIKVEPYQTEMVKTLKLSDWYETLPKGDYFLSIEYRIGYLHKFKHIGDISFKIK